MELLPLRDDNNVHRKSALAESCYRSQLFLVQDAEKCSGSCDSCGVAKDKMQ